GLRLFNEARDVLYDLKNSHKGFFYSNPLSQGLIAKSFELEGRWDRAENEYRFLAETFPTTAEGFSSYLHIINHYRENGPAHLLDTWRERALEFFSEMALRNPGTGVEATAHSFKAEVYRGQDDWQKAVEELTLVVQKFPSSSIGRRSALTGALIYRDKLNNQNMADSLIDLYRKSFPGEHDESLL
ncbi:MAG TPA: tetratricopeptide repeat protein, partial [candidate division Zixibacteria bacterium]|nr:tetratricopeptide repeat protein [candidate division Zixibacteria bacterium]